PIETRRRAMPLGGRVRARRTGPRDFLVRYRIDTRARPVQANGGAWRKGSDGAEKEGLLAGVGSARARAQVENLAGDIDVDLPAPGVDQSPPDRSRPGQ